MEYKKVSNAKRKTLEQNGTLNKNPDKVADNQMILCRSNMKCLGPPKKMVSVF
jgi:hypothetical protein